MLALHSGTTLHSSRLSLSIFHLCYAFLLISGLSKSIGFSMNSEKMNNSDVGNLFRLRQCLQKR